MSSDISKAVHNGEIIKDVQSKQLKTGLGRRKVKIARGCWRYLRNIEKGSDVRYR